MEMQDILKIGSRKVFSSLPKSLLVSHALVRLGSHYRELERQRIKKAFLLTPSMVNRAVEQQLLKDGLRNLPKVKWEVAFVGTIRNLANRGRWSETLFEDVLSSVLGDILVGENLDSKFGPWTSGSLGKAIAKWQAEGKTDQDIQKIMGSYVYRKSLNKHQDLTRGPQTGLGQGTKDRDKGDPAGIVEEIFLMKDIDKTKANNWMSIVKETPELRILLQEISDKIESRDPKMKLLWKAYLENPDVGDLAELAKEVVRFKDSEGILRDLPLWEALGKKEPRQVQYEVRKLQEYLESQWPSMRKMVHEIV